MSDDFNKRVDNIKSRHGSVGDKENSPFREHLHRINPSRVPPDDSTPKKRDLLLLFVIVIITILFVFNVLLLYLSKEFPTFVAFWGSICASFILGLLEVTAAILHWKE